MTLRSHSRTYAKSYKSMRRGYGAHFYDGVTRNWQVVSLGAFRDAVL